MAGSIARAGPSTPKREDVDLARDSRPDGSREGSGDGTGAPATLWAGQRSTRSMTTSRLQLAEMRQVHYFATRPSKTTPGFRVHQRRRRKENPLRRLLGARRAAAV